MTKKSTGKAGMCKWQTRGGVMGRPMTLLAAVGVAGFFGMGLLGCDTAARISFPNRTFQRVESLGFIPAGGACMGVEEGDMKVRFLMFDDKSKPIVLGSGVDTPQGGSTGAELTSDSVSFSNAALMEVHSDACSDNSECSSTPFNYSCERGPGLSGEAPKACLVTESGLTTSSRSDAVSYISDQENDRVFGIMLSSTGRLVGWNPPGTEGYWDRNGDGVINNEDVDGVRDDMDGGEISLGRDIATDLSNKSIAGLKKVFDPWVDSVKLARETKRNTYFGLWGFNLEKGTTPYLDKDGRRGTPWSRDANQVDAAIKDYSSQSFNSRSTSNVYEAMIETIEEAYSDSEMNAIGVADPAKVDKHLVVVVDGFDELRRPSKDIEAVIDAAKANNVRVYVMHFDPQLQRPERVRDLPEYHEDQDPCSSDSDCKNFEVCAKVRGYVNPDDVVGDADVPTNVPDETYCRAERDEAGRVGPIHEYSRIACETSGAYVYMPSVEAVERNLPWMPYVMDGMWEATVSSSRLRGKDNLGGAAMKLQAEMRVNLSGQTQNYSFSQTGAAGDNIAEQDTRAAIFGAP